MSAARSEHQSMAGAVVQKSIGDQSRSGSRSRSSGKGTPLLDDDACLQCLSSPNLGSDGSGVLRGGISPSSLLPFSPGDVDASTSPPRYHFMATERSLAALLRSLQSTSSFEDASG